MKSKNPKRFSSDLLTQRPWLWCEIERRAFSDDLKNKNVSMSYHSDGSCYARSWQRFYEISSSLIVFLKQLGLRRYDHVVLDASIRCESMAVFCAVQALGAITVFFPTALPLTRKCEEIVELEASVIFVDNPRKIKIYEESLANHAKLHFIYMDIKDESARFVDTILSWPPSDNIHDFDNIVDSQHVKLKTSDIVRVCDDYPAAFVFSQGSTQAERRLPMTHGMVRLQSEELVRALDLQANQKILSDMRDAHAVSIACFGASVLASAQCIWANPEEEIYAFIARVQAEIIFFIPHRIHLLYRELISRDEGVLDKQWTKLSVSAAKFRKRSVSPWLDWSKPLIERFFVRRFSQFLGATLKSLVSYGNLFDSRAAEFFSFLDIKCYNAYCFSEIGGFSHIQAFNGAGGFFQSIEHQRLSGILHLRYKKLAGNWVSTQDHVFEDERCGLCVQRKLVVELASGISVDVAALQDSLRHESLIEEVVIFGAGQSFLSALIYLNKDELMQWASLQKIDEKEFSVLSQLPKVYEHIKLLVDRHNFSRSSHEAISKIALLPTVLANDERILTPSKLTRRYEVERKYRGILQSFYEDSF